MEAATFRGTCACKESLRTPSHPDQWLHDARPWLSQCGSHCSYCFTRCARTHSLHHAATLMRTQAVAAQMSSESTGTVSSSETSAGAAAPEAISVSVGDSKGVQLPASSTEDAGPSESSDLADWRFDVVWMYSPTPRRGGPGDATVQRGSGHVTGWGVSA